MVENYFNQELTDVVFEIEALDTWKELSEQLGLEKQLDFVKGKESPLPYPYLNESMVRIYSTLCPRKVDFKKYDKTPIPLEVLEQIALCIKEKYFKQIEIWYDDKTPDPVVVGTICKYYTYNKEGKRTEDFNTKEEAEINKGNGWSVYETDINRYIVARWGDVLRPLRELKDLAKERIIDKFASELKKEITEKTEALKVIQENANLYLLAEISENQLKGKSW
jgi:hypothetical protein